MAKFEDYPMIGRAVALVVGDSGAGKTSLFADLANNGYKVRIADTDSKLVVLNKHLTKEGRDNVSFITYKDDLSKKANAYKNFLKIFGDGWKDGDEDLGRVQDWGPDTVLGLDSLTFLGELMKYDALSQRGAKAGELLMQGEWYAAQRAMASLLEYLTSPDLKCNVVATALPQTVEDDMGISRIYPSVVSKNYSTQVGRYFDNVVRIQSKRDGEKQIRTKSDNRMELKVAATLPDVIEPSLVPLFEALGVKLK